MTDGGWSRQAFAESPNVHFPLLSAVHPKSAVARAFGIYRPAAGNSERALFVIDGEAIIRWSDVSPVGATPARTASSTPWMRCPASRRPNRSRSPSMTGDVARRNGHSKSPYSTSVTGASAVRRDPDRLRADRGSEAGEQAVQLDFVGGARSGVNGTPTVYVDGVRPDGPHTAGTLGAAIEKGLPGG